MITTFVQPKPRVPIPTPEFAREAVLKYFRPVEDTFFVVRCHTVAKVVALSFGVSWSPRITTVCTPVLAKMGVKRIVFNGQSLYRGIVPVNLTDEEARKLSAELRPCQRRKARP